MKTAVTLLILSLSCMATWAQDLCLIKPRTALLLEDQPMLKELKLSDAQHTQLTEYFQVRQQEVLNERWLLQKDTAHYNAMDDDIARYLNSDQLQHLKEHWLHHNGLVTLTDAKIADEMQLTDSQRNKIATLANKMREQLRELKVSSAGNAASIRNDYLRLRHETNRAIEAMLRDLQKHKFARMQGERFEQIHSATRNKTTKMDGSY